MGEGDSNGFIQTISTFTDGGIPLRKYKSEISGLSVCIAEAEGPLVAGYLCIATEAHDDDGLPHTLEHLIFLGSEQYPYKGILDILANRCLASGTNAWTDTDHTCYTMTTAGSEGFLKLLPIYVDHLLYPTLTDSAYVTEVHHVNSEGEDAGIVYCEMQACENSGENRCHLSMLRAMFPGHCGYKSETGGLMKNLRESTNNEKVRAYHKEFYRPENLCIMIVGQIEAKDVFKSLQTIEERIKNEEPRKPFIRPWQSPVPPLEESITIDIEYPCDEDEFGIVIASWRGPEAKDYSQLISIQILLEYLTDTSISPLQRDFVESSDPYCNQVDFTVIENSVSCIYLHFANVAVEKLSLMKRKLLSILEKIASGVEELDMKRMETVIQKKKLYILNRMESSPHDQLAMSLIGDFLYGSTLSDLQQRVQQVPVIEGLLKATATFWKNLLKTYMVDGPFVFVLGRPSPKLAEEMTEEEKKRIIKQHQKLGPDGLRKMDEILKHAMMQNEIQAPDEMISAVSVPSVQSIKFHTIQRYTNYTKDSSQPTIDYALEKMPCPFQLDVVKSNFVRMYVLLDTSDVPQNLRLLLPLFVELLEESSIRRNGELIPYQEVVKQLADDTISICTKIGLSYKRFSCDTYPQVLCLSLMVEEERYLKGIQWIKELLYHTVFEPTRIKSIINKMIADVAKLRRDGIFVAKTMMRNVCFSPKSNHWAVNMIRQHGFLSELQKTLASKPDEVIKSLNDLREMITHIEKVTIHLAVNLTNLKQKTVPEDPWITEFLPLSNQTPTTKSRPKQCYELLETSVNKIPREIIIGNGSVESSYLMTSAPCINSFTHPDYAALLVVIQYLVQLEGPMWRQIRGMGLSYTYSIFVRPNEGMIYFVLFKSTLIVRAYKESQRIVESHLNNQIPWDLKLLESACSSLVFNIIEEEKTIADVVKQSVTAYYRNVDITFTKTLLEKISQVTPADMERVGNLYLRPLFSPDLSKCIICCHPSKVNGIVNGFKQFSRDLTVVPSLEDPFMSQY